MTHSTCRTDSLAWIAALLLATCAPAAPPESAPASEAALWQQITTFNKTRPRVGSQPAAAVLDALRGQLRRLELYRTLFPGGRHIADAIAAELEAATEIGILSGDFSDLCERVRAWQRHRPAAAAEPEIAYYAILCDRLAGRFDQPASRPASQPATRPASQPPPVRDALLAAWLRYVQRYPRSRHTPALCEQLFSELARQGDAAGMRQIVNLLHRYWPQRAVTARLRRRLNQPR